MQRSLAHHLQHHLALRVLCSGHIPGVPPAPPSPAVSIPLGDIQPSHTGTPRERPGHYQGEFFSSGSPRKAA